MRIGLTVLWILFGSVAPATAQVQANIGIGFPHLRIGINLPVYPELERVPGYPVYYAPQVDGNYFFYDGMYWVYQDDNWYASSWYNGPWGLVEPAYVPVFLLRVPVRYYRHQPAYFRGWEANVAPRWNEHWGNDWAKQRPGWDQWDRRARKPAPQPVYQRQFTGEHYPQQVEQQQQLRNQNYHYKPRTRVVRQHYRAPMVAPQPAEQQQSHGEGKGHGKQNKDQGQNRGQGMGGDHGNDRHD